METCGLRRHQTIKEMKNSLTSSCPIKQWIVALLGTACSGLLQKQFSTESPGLGVRNLNNYGPLRSCSSHNCLGEHSGFLVCLLLYLKRIWLEAFCCPSGFKNR